MRNNRTVVTVSKGEWERFLETVEELVEVHVQLLRQMRQLRSRENILKEQLRDVLHSRTRQISQNITSRVTEAVQQLAQMESQSMVLAVCATCGRQLLESYRYCDRCGGRLGW